MDTAWLFATLASIICLCLTFDKQQGWNNSKSVASAKWNATYIKNLCEKLIYSSYMWSRQRVIAPLHTAVCIQAIRAAVCIVQMWGPWSRSPLAPGWTKPPKDRGTPAKVRRHRWCMRNRRRIWGSSYLQKEVTYSFYWFSKLPLLEIQKIMENLVTKIILNNELLDSS